MKIVIFKCDDPYEAEKLASLVSVQKDDSVYIDGIAAVVGNEIVIKLKDKSSHAVVLKDKEDVDRLRSILLDVVDGKIRIRSSEFFGSMVRITLG